MKKGEIIAIEGIDGSGKYTVSTLLVQKLRKEGHATVMISFPRYGKKSAAPIELYLQETEAPMEVFGPYHASALFAIDRSFARPHIELLLNDGTIIVLDRYVTSNAGHQGGRIADDEKRAQFLYWLYDFEYEKLRVVRPDINIILDLPLEIALKRKATQKKSRNERLDAHEKSETHLANAWATYRWLAKHRPDEFVVVKTVKDGYELTPEEVLEKVWLVVRPLL